MSVIPSSQPRLETQTPRDGRGGAVRRLPAVGRLTQPLLPLVLSVATAAACLALAASQADPTERAEGRLLALLAAAVVACASFAAQLGGGKWTVVPAAGSTLVWACLWLLHQGPQRGGAVVLVLAITLAAALARSWRRVEAGAWGACLAWSTSLAVGVQILVRPDLFLPARLAADEAGLFGAISLGLGPGGADALWIEGIVLPALFGVGLGLLAAGLGRPALLAGAVLLLAGPGVDVPRLTILGPALLLALGLVWLWHLSGFEARWPLTERLETLTARTLLLLGVAGVLLSSYPWLRPAPWTELAHLLGPARTAAVAHERGVAVLRTPSVWRQTLDAPAKVSAVILDSSLVHGTGATGRAVAMLIARDPAGDEVGRWPVVGGEHTAEWAAARPDVRSLEGFRAPDPWTRYVPPSGAFFAHRYRARFDLDTPATVASVEIAMPPPDRSSEDGVGDVGGDGGAALELHLVRLELRR